MNDTEKRIEYIHDLAGHQDRREFVREQVSRAIAQKLQGDMALWDRLCWGAAAVLPPHARQEDRETKVELIKALIEASNLGF